MNRCKVGRCSWNRVTICSLFAKRFMFAEVGIAASQSAVEKVTPWNCIKEGPCPCRCPCPCPLLLFVYSLTEVYFLGFSWTFKRVYTENTHKAWSGFCGRPARDRNSNFKIHRGFSSKSFFKKNTKKWKNRLFFQRKIFARDKTLYKNRLWWKSSTNLSGALSGSDRLSMRPGG